ncbi:MAG TPA: ABC transporter permease [Vicinamibacteria bacterium]|nr:ABC transporter permease [Vicinamibacteria bacterium]
MGTLQDLRYATRQFLKAPGFTATVILTLALGIGATTSIFTLVHAVLLKSLPVFEPHELYRVGDNENCCVNGGMQGSWSLFSYAKYEHFRDEVQGFSELAAFQAGRSLAGVRRSGSEQPAESQQIQYVSGNFFSMFGVGSYIGRVFKQDDDREGVDPVVVMSYRTWSQKYGMDPSVIGASFTFNGRPFTVVGVTPPSFSGDRLDRTPAFWIPIHGQRLTDGSPTLMDFPTSDWLDIIGRIAPGADPERIEAQLQVLLRQWLLSPVAELDEGEKELVANQTLKLSPGGAGVQMMRNRYESGLRLLMWVSGFVLLIACANVANLMLVRAVSRREQTCLRTALGAGRSRQIAQVLTESTALGILGGLAGIALAFWGTSLILKLAFRDNAVAIDPMPSLPVLGFTLAVSVLTGVVFGVVPAWMTAKIDPADALRNARRSTGHSGGWTQKSLVVAQAALSLVLLAAAGLLTESLRNMQRQDFGFEPENRYIFHLDPRMAAYDADALPGLYRQLEDDLLGIPGVRRVSFSMYAPMEGNNWGETVYIDGQEPPPPGSFENGSSWLRVSPGYFETLGTAIVQGRAFTEQDNESSRHVAMVNETFATKFFQSTEDAIGRRFGDLDQKYAGAFEIIGVVEDAQYLGPTREIPPRFYLPSAQWMQYDVPRLQAFEESNHFLNTAVLLTEATIPRLEPQVRTALAKANPDLALIDFMAYDDLVDGNFSQQAMLTKLTSLFGALALILASIGLYGTTAYSVERRTSEIGIRMALGADRWKVLKLVFRGAFSQVGIGLAIGIPASIAAGHAMTTQLFEVKPYSPAILLVTIVVLSLAAFVASIVPAQRASSLEASRALRME